MPNIPVGTAIWKKPTVKATEVGKLNSETLAKYPPTVAETVFVGVTCRDGEPSDAFEIPVRNDGEAFALVKGPIAANETIGGNGSTGLIARSASPVGIALEPIVGANEKLIRVKLGPSESSAFERPLFVRHVGIDAMWVSRPKPPLIYKDGYWYGPGPGSEDATDTSEHYFCLKPFQLQNRYWWDEVLQLAIPNIAYGIVNQNDVDLVSGQLGMDESVQSVGPLTRRLFGTLIQDIDPPYVAELWSIFYESKYYDNTAVIGARIPKGLLVCDQNGKVVWDYFDTLYAEEKPETLPSVETWHIGADRPPAEMYPGVFAYSPPKVGLYDVEFIDINVDARKWKSRPPINDAQLAYLHLPRSSGESYTMKILDGEPQWILDT